MRNNSQTSSDDRNQNPPSGDTTTGLDISIKPMKKILSRRKQDSQASLFTKGPSGDSKDCYDDPYSDRSTVEEQEDHARKAAREHYWNPLWVTGTTFAAAAKVFLVYLVTLDTVLCNVATILMTLYWWDRIEERPQYGGMHFILVSFAVAVPISVTLRVAFDRREKALTAIANARSCTLHMYMAHALWDWKSDGRQETKDFDFVQHCDEVLRHLIGIGDAMTRFLTLPTFSLPRHRVLRSGRTQAAQTIRVAYQLLDSVLLQHMTRLAVLAERLKALGLSGSEVSRLRQYERHLSCQLEELRMLKVYRTPQALWAFGRIFTLLLPPFYAPTFAKMGHDLGNLWLGVLFAMITATSLTALFESSQVLEDPFTAFLTLDGIDVSEELEVLQWTQLINARKLLFPQAPSYPMQTRAALSMMSGYDPNVHYHSTPALRFQMHQRQWRKSVRSGATNTDPFGDVEMGGETRRKSHFAKEVFSRDRFARSEKRVPLASRVFNSSPSDMSCSATGDETCYAYESVDGATDVYTV
jgi:hypothetical protein